MPNTGTYFEQISTEEIATILAQQISLGTMNPQRGSWETRMDTSNRAILEILQQNSSWWEHAAVACEKLAPRLASGEKEEWLLLCAVYRERAGIHARLVEELRRKSDGAHG